MKINYAILAMTGLALVAGCNRGATNNSAAKGNTANAAAAAPAAPAANAAAPASGTPVTQAALVGTWGQDNCTNTMSFAADGTATSSGATSNNVRWTLDGSTIVITAPGQPETRMPAAMAGENLQLSNAAGQTMVMTKCPAAGGGAAAQGNSAAEEAAEEGEKSE